MMNDNTDNTDTFLNLEPLLENLSEQDFLQAFLKGSEATLSPNSLLDQTNFDVLEFDLNNNNNEQNIQFVPIKSEPVDVDAQQYISDEYLSPFDGRNAFLLET
jgi:hypothetical protein